MANTIKSLSIAAFLRLDGDTMRAETVYKCDFSEMYDKIVYFARFECKRAETAARRMAKIIGIDVSTMPTQTAVRYSENKTFCDITETDGGYIVYVNLMNETAVNDETETDDDTATNETAANDTDDTDTETAPTNDDTNDTDDDTATPFARLRKLCGASLKYDATKSGDAAKPIYTFTAANGDGGIVTRHNSYYEINVNGNIVELYDDGGRVVRVAENNDDTRTAYRRALDATTNDTAANYDDDAHRTVKLDARKSTPKKKIYRVNSTAAHNAAKMATKCGNYDDAPKTKRAPRYIPAVILTTVKNGDIVAAIDSITVWENGTVITLDAINDDTAYYTAVILPPRCEFVRETMRTYPHIPFVEISGDTVSKRGKIVKRTYHIIDNMTPYGDIMNALLCARISIKLKRDKLSANGGNTIVMKLEKRDNALSRVYREMCANYDIFGNMQIYADDAHILCANYTDDDTAKKTDETDETAKNADENTPKSAAAYITAKLTYLAETDDGETYEILMTALKEIYSGAPFAISTKTAIQLDAVKSIYAPRKYTAVYLPHYVSLSPQTRYNELSAINDYLSAETKTIEIDSFDINGDAVRDNSGRRVKQTIYINRLDDETTNGDDTDDGDDGKNTKFSIMDIVSLENYRRAFYTDMETAYTYDDATNAAKNYDLWLDTLTAETRDFIAVYADICGGANRRGGNGGANGLRTVAKKCGISYKRARTLETAVKRSFNNYFPLQNAHISRYPLAHFMYNKIKDIAENDAKTNGKYIAYNNAPAVKFAPLTMCDFSDDINDGLYMYIARKYAIMRTYREMMTHFKRA